MCLVVVLDNRTLNEMKNPINRLDYIDQFAIFSQLNPNQRYNLSKLIEIEKFEKHQFIYRPGEKSSKVYFIINGTIKIGRYSSTKKEIIKSILHPQTMFGEQAIFGEVTRDDFALALDDKIVCYSIDKDKFYNFISETTSVAMSLLTNVGKKLKMAERRFESLVVEDARTRIIDFLKFNADQFGQKVGVEMLIKHSLTQQDIANFTGTSRQTVTSVLNDLKRTNQIFFKRKSILIRDITSLS